MKIEDIVNIVLDYIKNKLLDFIFDFIKTIITSINSVGYDLFDLTWVKGALYFFEIFGFAMYISGLSIAIYNIAIDYTQHNHLSIKHHILPIFFGYLYTSLFTKIPPILYSFCLDLQSEFSSSLIKLLFNQDMVYPDLSSITYDSLTEISSLSFALSSIYAILILYCIFKVFISTIKRSGVLLTMIGVNAINMFSISSGNGLENCKRWAKQILGLCITGFFQTTLLTLGLMTFSINGLLGIGVMLSASEVEKVSGQLGLDVSAKDSFRSLKQSTMDIIRTGKMLAVI